MQNTKKKKQGINKKKVWSLFEKAIPEAKKIECLYSNSSKKTRDKCDLCEYAATQKNSLSRKLLIRLAIVC